MSFPLYCDGTESGRGPHRVDGSWNCVGCGLNVPLDQRMQPDAESLELRRRRVAFFEAIQPLVTIKSGVYAKYDGDDVFHPEDLALLAEADRLIAENARDHGIELSTPWSTYP
jgi:hypothetical protein